MEQQEIKSKTTNGNVVIVNVDNPGESTSKEFADWRDVERHYFDFSCDYDNSGTKTQFSVSRFYGALDTESSDHKYNTYRLTTSANADQIIREFEYHFYGERSQRAQELECKTLYYILMKSGSIQSQILDLYIIYYFLDQRLNRSIHQTNDNDKFAIAGKINIQNKEISNDFYRSLGFEISNDENKDLIITKKTFNERKDQWLEKLQSINLEKEKTLVSSEIAATTPKQPEQEQNKPRTSTDNKNTNKDDNEDRETNANKKSEEREPLIDKSKNKDQEISNLKFNLPAWKKILGTIVELLLTFLCIRKKITQEQVNDKFKNFTLIEKFQNEKNDAKTWAEQMRFDNAVEFYLNDNKKSN